MKLINKILLIYKMKFKSKSIVIYLIFLLIYSVFFLINRSKKQQDELHNEVRSIKFINKKYSFSFNQKKVHQLETDLSKLREHYNELLEHSDTLKSELNNLRKQLHEKEKVNSSKNQTKLFSTY